MTFERAMEILDPEHREHYGSIDIVNEACMIARNAIGYRIPEQVGIERFDDRKHFAYICPSCKAREVYAEQEYCHVCGQHLKWK